MTEPVNPVIALREASREWRETRTEAGDARDTLIDHVRAASEYVSEYQLADIVGVSRPTIRAWLGK